MTYLEKALSLIKDGDVNNLPEHCEMVYFIERFWKDLADSIRSTQCPHQWGFCKEDIEHDCTANCRECWNTEYQEVIL